MTVRELIERLKNFDPDLPVRINDTRWECPSLENVDMVYVQGLDHGIKVVVLDV